MTTKVPKGYYLVPFLYLILIGFFIYLHLFSYETFSERIGPVTIEGDLLSGKKNKGETVKNLSVSVYPLTFRFSRNDPLLVKMENDTTKNVTIQGYTLFPDGAELRFTDDLFLRISVRDQQKREISFQFYGGGYTNNVTFQIPYILSETTEWVSPGRIPVLSLSNKGEYSILSSSQGALFDPQHSLILLSPVEGTLPAIVFQAVDRDNKDPLTFWFSKDALKVEKKAYDEIIAQYIEDSYQGWINSRYNRTSGEWEGPEGSYRFDEPLLNALFAESIVRGEYERMYLRFSESVKSHSQERTYLTTPFLGNLTREAPELRENFDELVDDLTVMAAEEDFRIFTVPDLLLFVLNHGPYSLVEEIYRLGRVAECDETDYSLCLGLAETFLQGDRLLLSGGESPIDFTAVIEDGILPWIIKTEEGLFLEVSRGIVDTLSSLKAGYLLVQVGEKTDNAIFTSIGRYMVISVLSLSEARGFLPEKLIIKNGSIAEKHERIAPEKVYPLLSANPYYPHEIPLHKEIGPGAWIFTCANIHSLQITDTSAEIELSFPQGMSHHMIIQGVPPFARMQFYDINWVSDPSFEAYSSGWVYDERRKTLYIKLRHRQELETVRIFFTE